MSTALATNTLDGLRDKATMMRIHSVRSTTEAGSGHPTTCASAAEVMTALFFDAMRYDPQDPASEANDVFILSKGHAAPVLYAAWSEVGYIPEKELLNLRRIDSDLEGHPPTTLPFVDVATGSLGQGLSVGVGMAHACRLDGNERRIWVLLGDGEVAEGSVWEAASMAANDGLGNLIATVDVNRLGQSAPTMLQHDMDAYRIRWEAFGWETLVVDGHDLEALIEAYAQARESAGQPTVILAKTYKGRGHPLRRGQGWLARQAHPQRRACGRDAGGAPGPAYGRQLRLDPEPAPRGQRAACGAEAGRAAPVPARRARGCHAPGIRSGPGGVGPGRFARRRR